MLYSITLISEKSATKNQALKEIEDYIKEKKGKIISQKQAGEINVNKKEISRGIIKRLEIEAPAEEIAKIRKKISQEKQILSFILEKTKQIRPEKKPVKIERKARKKESSKVKTKKVLASMQEEEKKIKDLDSTLDMILNE